jgi:hypothetical protein
MNLKKAKGPLSIKRILSTFFNVFNSLLKPYFKQFKMLREFVNTNLPILES